MKSKELLDKLDNLLIVVDQEITYIKVLINSGKKVDFQDTMLAEEDIEKISSIIKELEQNKLCSKDQVEKIKKKRDSYNIIIDNMRKRNFKAY